MRFRGLAAALSILAALLAAPLASRAQTGQEVPVQPERRHVFVFGDKMATGLLAGLWRVLKDNPNYIARGRMYEGSGLARPRYYDWRRAIPKVLGSKPVDIGIILLGANDARNMRVNGKTLLFGSPEWRVAYAQRVDDIVNIFREKGIPLFWVGLPPVADAGRNEALKYINAIFRERTKVSGVRFVDIYKAFSTNSGGYTDKGPDIHGRQTRLRARNGVQFIKAGNTRLAAIVVAALGEGLPEKDNEAAPDAAKPDLTSLPQFGYAMPSGEAGLVRAQLLPDRNSIFPAAPVRQNEAAAAARQAHARHAVKPGTAAARLFSSGEWPRSRKGRIDDFSPPR